MTLLPNEVISTLTKNQGHLVKSAKELGVKTSFLRKWIETNPAVYEEYQDITQQLVEDAISGLHLAVLDCKFDAIKYVLDHLGQDRGFGSKAAPKSITMNQQNNIDLSTLTMDEKRVLFKLAKERAIDVDAITGEQ